MFHLDQGLFRRLDLAGDDQTGKGSGFEFLKAAGVLQEGDVPRQGMVGARNAGNRSLSVSEDLALDKLGEFCNGFLHGRL